MPSGNDIHLQVYFTICEVVNVIVW
jgi:hypothetical protein